MALDVYVMPLWRFKAGDFTSPIEASLGIEPVVITLADSPLPPTPWYLRLLLSLGLVERVQPPPEPSSEQRRAAATREVDALKSQLTQMIGVPIEWSDRGGIHYNEQFGQPVVMRAFASWHDHRDELPRFTAPPERNYYKHPVWSLPKPRKTRFPTLIEHNLNTGYLLPVSFEGVHRVEPFKIMDRWEFFHHVASTQAMLREASDLLAFVTAVADGGDTVSESGLLDDIRWHAAELKRMCELSIEHNLPVIFYG